MKTKVEKQDGTTVETEVQYLDDKLKQVLKERPDLNVAGNWFNAEEITAGFERARRAEREARAAVKLAPVGQRPKCLGCDKELRPFRYRHLEWAIRDGKKYGDYGDNKFCGLRCGHRYGIAAANHLARR